MLPLEIENIIIDYKNQLEYTEKLLKKEKKKLLKKKIINFFKRLNNYFLGTIFLFCIFIQYIIICLLLLDLILQLINIIKIYNEITIRN